jgi:hypothetical protein
MASQIGAGSPRLFYIRPGDWTWWAWAITTGLLMAGLDGCRWAFLAAMGLTLAQLFILLFREPDRAAFSIQLRAAYFLLLLICYLPLMRWLYWLPAMGTFALITFGYCLMARVLSLMPWNGREAYSCDRLRRTFLSAPDLDRAQNTPARAGCAGGLCTIDAQVEPGSGGNVNEKKRNAAMRCSNHSDPL